MSQPHDESDIEDETEQERTPDEFELLCQRADDWQDQSIDRERERR